MKTFGRYSNMMMTEVAEVGDVVRANAGKLKDERALVIKVHPGGKQMDVRLKSNLGNRKITVSSRTWTRVGERSQLTLK